MLELVIKWHQTLTKEFEFFKNGMCGKLNEETLVCIMMLIRKWGMFSNPIKMEA